LWLGVWDSNYALDSFQNESNTPVTVRSRHQLQIVGVVSDTVYTSTAERRDREPLFAAGAEL